MSNDSGPDMLRRTSMRGIWHRRLERRSPHAIPVMNSLSKPQLIETPANFPGGAQYQQLAYLDA